MGKVATSVMANISATHNFVFKGETKKLALKLETDSGCMETMNFKAFITIGMAKQVSMKLDLW